MKRICTILFLFLVSGASPTAWSEEEVRVYEDFTLWIDCENRVAVRFQYQLDKDVGNTPRKNNYRPDPALPKDCQQKTTDSYRDYTNLIEQHDRGHLVPFNHMDHSASSSGETNYMTNILPQASAMNQQGGAWYRTELISECFRDHYVLKIIGGAVWDEDSQYLKKHAIRVPKHFWKVIVRGDEIIAWIIPNSKEGTEERIDDFLVSVKEIEERINGVIPVSDVLKGKKVEKSWDGKYCDIHSDKDCWEIEYCNRHSDHSDDNWRS